MRQRRAHHEDSKIEGERRARYQRTARVSLEVLPDQSTELDKAHVEYLLEIFRREGCRPQPVQNHILVLIHQSCLHTALERPGIDAVAPITPPVEDYRMLQLPVGTKLECLHGKHRIQAARDFLSPREKWWVADLYSSGVYLLPVFRLFSLFEIQTCRW